MSAEVRYAIVYLAVPLFAEDGEVPPQEEDAAAIGEIVWSSVVSSAPLDGVQLMGTRLTKNNLVAPGISRI